MPTSSRFVLRARLRQSPGELLAPEPSRSRGVESLDFVAFERGHVALDGKADPGLRVGQVPIAFGELREQGRVERELHRRIDGIEAVLFIDRLAQNDRPYIVAPFEEIVKAPGADDVAGYAVN